MSRGFSQDNINGRPLTPNNRGGPLSLRPPGPPPYQVATRLYHQQSDGALNTRRAQIKSRNDFTPIEPNKSPSHHAEQKTNHDQDQSQSISQSPRQIYSRDKRSDYMMSMSRSQISISQPNTPQENGRSPRTEGELYSQVTVPRAYTSRTGQKIIYGDLSTSPADALPPDAHYDEMSGAQNSQKKTKSLVTPTPKQRRCSMPSMTYHEHKNQQQVRYGHSLT